MKGSFASSLVLLLLVGAAYGHSASQHSVRLVEFNPPLAAPAFTLPGLEAEAVSLGHYRGQFVLLNFWATWCPPCVKEMPSMERLTSRLDRHPFTVLAVSLDEEADVLVAPFVERLGVTFKIALDPDSRVAALYGAKELPVTFLIDAEGRVVAAAKGERDWGSDDIVEFLLERIGEGNDE